jgi:hypothetical protein
MRCWQTAQRRAPSSEMFASRDVSGVSFATRAAYPVLVLERAARLGYLALGFLFVGLGVIGAFLPVMPTTVFLIGALWAFSMSSKRLEDWLLHHPRFGPRLVEWRAHRVIPLRAKLFAWGSMAASLAIMIAVRVPVWAIATAAALMLVGVVYIARCPSKPPE